jgi:hypothetical protein
MDSGRTRYEILVATLLNQASLATFRFSATTTVVPRRTVYRLRVPAGRDLSEVVHRLTDHDVQVLEIRQCVEAGPEPGVAGTARPAPQAESAEAAGDAGTVVSFPTARAVARPERTPAPAERPADPVVEARDPAGVETTAVPARHDRRGHLRAVPC